ncbi:sigma 54-interacting transcriptional regulator [bacterium]|nr:sigma 54-interacting transcriptional regulator [bacterium]
MNIWFRTTSSITISRQLQSNLDKKFKLTSDPGATTVGVYFIESVTDAHIGSLINLSYNLLHQILVVLPKSPTDNEIFKLYGAGASDVVFWNGEEKEFKRIENRLNRWLQVDKIMKSDSVQKTCVCRAVQSFIVFREIVRIAYFTNSSVLLVGESGTGKEAAARLIHLLDQRPDKQDFRVVDCTTIVPELSGSEFFGHEKGAFTGAITSRDGAFSLADQGTLFLDEIGDLPLHLQAQLLRVIQERVYKRVGSNTWLKTEFRLICATHRDLEAEVRAGRFRQDLYHRIGQWTLRMPSLHERREDIPFLMEHFINESNASALPSGIEDLVVQMIGGLEFPGNIRQLKHLTQRMIDNYVGPGPLTLGDLPDDIRASVRSAASSPWCGNDFVESIRHAIRSGVQLKEIGRTAENIAIQIAMENGQTNRAADMLGVTPRALQMRRAQGRRTRGGRLKAE